MAIGLGVYSVELKVHYLSAIIVRYGPELVNNRLKRTLLESSSLGGLQAFL